MKRLFAAALTVFLLLSAVGSYSEEVRDSSVYSYDFDLGFHLNPDGFPPRVRSHIRGYSDLLDVIRMKGNLTWSDETGSLDLDLNIIPLTNPSAKIAMHFFGIPEHICMSSSLLGDEIIWFQNYVLMEFALKSWNNLHLPLQYLALLFPYVTENAFQKLVKDWTETVGRITVSQNIPKEKLEKVSDLWAGTLQEDQRLIYWITGLSVLSEDHMILDEEINKLPEYLLQNVSGNRDISVQVKDGETIWTNHEKQVLYRESAGGNSWSYTLPVTENGYIPCLSCESASSGGLSRITINGSYHMADEDKDTGRYPEGQPASLLDFSLDIRDLPEKWPADSSFSAALNVIGSLLPNFDIKMKGETKENGELIISVYDLSDKSAGTESVLICSGSIVPVSPGTVPEYSTAELTRHLNVFSVNDKTVSEFSGKIRRPLITGILNLLDEMPASACQSVMDDLEEYGLVNILLGEE